MLLRRYGGAQPAAVHGPQRDAVRTIRAVPEPVGHHEKATVAAVRAPVQLADVFADETGRRRQTVHVAQAQETVSGHPDRFGREHRVVVRRERAVQPDQDKKESRFRRRPGLVTDSSRSLRHVYIYIEPMRYKRDLQKYLSK